MKSIAKRSWESSVLGVILEGHKDTSPENLTGFVNQYVFVVSKK